MTWLSAKKHMTPIRSVDQALSVSRSARTKLVQKASTLRQG
jgi:hypothetical protein